jgi:hypothetical protein
MAGTDAWAIVGPLLAGYGTIIGFLIKRDGDREKKMDALYEKMIQQVVPALERATAAAQGLLPILERDAAAMGAVTEATADLVKVTAQMATWIAVLSDRQARDPGRPRN